MIKSRLTKEVLEHNIVIIKNNILDVETGRSSEFNIDELYEDLEHLQECLDVIEILEINKENNYGNE